MGFDIDVAEGELLTFLGKIVGQARLGADDDAYRVLLAARGFINKATGTFDEIAELIDVFFAAQRNYLHSDRGLSSDAQPVHRAR